MQTVVSITPLKVEADSRAFKIATSIARFGYTSILVEGERSDIDKTRLPFRLVSMAATSNREKSHAPLQNDATYAAFARRGFQAWKIVAHLRRLLVHVPGPLKRVLRPFFRPFLFLFRYLYDSCLRALKCIPKGSLYYLHSPSLFPAAYILSKKYDAPLIYDAHDFYAGIKSPRENDSLNFEQRWKHTFYRNVESRLINYASAVVTVSNGVASLQRAAYNRTPTVIRNCHDYRLDHAPRTGIRRAIGLSPDKFLLVVVGNAKDGMAIREAIQALLDLPSYVHLAFLGNYYGQYWDSVCGLGLQSRVHLVPPVKPFEVVPFIRGADASLILYYSRSVNYHNCLPNGFFQSIAAELPLLYPGLPEIKKIARKYQMGIEINPQDSISIGAAVIELLNYPERLTKYKKKLAQTRQDLNWEREEEILRQLIRDTLFRGNVRS